tara:strand:+ start:181 stop:360 length:180 start_codon:yes stop_codon:yes gene_type:complete
MSIFTESEKEPRAFKVLAYDENDELKAEYMFSELKEAMKFQIGMQEKGFTTTMQRLLVE